MDYTSHIIFSFSTIEYPYSTQCHEIVWFSDANVKYLCRKHIALLILGLVYTNKNTKLNCFIEAYHARYRPKYHYWTGLLDLLFLRVILNILVSLNIFGDPHYNLLTIGILIPLLIMLKTYIGNKVYKNKILDCATGTLLIGS